MAHSRGVLHKARFCPWCGTETIERDRFGGDNRRHKVEFICHTCGVGFAINESARRQMANRMFAESRRQRVPNPGQENPKTFTAICKRKWKQLKHEANRENRRIVGDRMKAWLESDEALGLRAGAFFLIGENGARQEQEERRP